MNAIQKVRVKSSSMLGFVDVGQGIPIILIHGLFLDHTAFDAQIEAFADRYSRTWGIFRVRSIDDGDRVTSERYGHRIATVARSWQK